MKLTMLGTGNALVRANYNNLQKGITATTKYLELFFENLLLGSNNELKEPIFAY